MIVTGKGEYSGTITKTFKILPKKDIKKATVSLSKTSYIYDGKSKTPTVTVTYSGKKLSKDKDYSVTYKNNKAVGTASVIVTGKGEYSGTITKTFKIISKKMPVKLDANGGTILANSKIFTIGNKWGELPTPTRKAYRFAGWYSEKSKGIQIKETMVVDGSVSVLYAHWIKLSATYVYKTFPEEMSFNVYSILKNGVITVTKTSDGWYYVFYYDNREVWIKTSAFTGKCVNRYDGLNTSMSNAINKYSTNSKTVVCKKMNTTNSNGKKTNTWSFSQMKVEGAPSGKGVVFTAMLLDSFSLEYIVSDSAFSKPESYFVKKENLQRHDYAFMRIEPSFSFGFSEKTNKVFSYQLSGKGVSSDDGIESIIGLVKLFKDLITVNGFGDVVGVASECKEFLYKENESYQMKTVVLPSNEIESYYGISCKSLYDLENKQDYFEVNIGLMKSVEDAGQINNFEFMAK